MTANTPRNRCSFGICVKNMNQVVIEQSKECEKICGKMLGLRCEKGCMKSFGSKEKKSDPALGYHVFPNFQEGDQAYDALVINDGEHLTTLLLPKEKFIARLRSDFEADQLTPAEMSVISLVLEGCSNRQIAERLFISRQTLKTHLNNINKKRPPSEDVESLRLRVRL